MKRRDFIKTTAAGAGALAVPSLLRAATDSKKRPNIIYIFTDQQSATMMSCAGNRYLKTPAADYMAANGVRFEKAYTPNPVCVPLDDDRLVSRFARDPAQLELK